MLHVMQRLRPLAAALALCGCAAPGLAQVEPTPVPARVAPAATPLDVKSLELDVKALGDQHQVVSRIRAALNEPDVKKRHAALLECAQALHPLTANTALPFAGRLRTALDETLTKMKPDPEPPVSALLDEVTRWEQLAQEMTAAQTAWGQQLDALRLLHKSVMDPTKRLSNLLQAENQLLRLATPTADARVRRSLDLARRLMGQLDPPALFTDNLAIDLVRPQVTAPFYVSRLPAARKWLALVAQDLKASGADGAKSAVAVAVASPAPAAADEPLTDLDWQATTQFCALLATRSGMDYALPSLEQYRKSGMTETTAMWTATVCPPANDFDAAMRERFRVPFYSVWDPAHRLSSSGIIGEIQKGAHYPGLGFRVVVSVDAVRRQWLDRVRQELNLPSLHPK